MRISWDFGVRLLSFDYEDVLLAELWVCLTAHQSLGIDFDWLKP